MPTATDSEITQFLDGVMGVVEATLYEYQCLWREYHEEMKQTWDENRRSLLLTVGQLADMPVCIEIRTTVVNNHKILFFDASSKVVDYRLIDAWLEAKLPTTARRDNGFINRENAMNFCNIFPRSKVSV